MANKRPSHPEFEAKLIELFERTQDAYEGLADGRLPEHTAEVPVKELSSALNVLGKKRTLQILYFLLVNEKIRFGELRKMMALDKTQLFKYFNLGQISSRTLSLRLKEFEKLGVVERRKVSDKPPCVEYSLTARGKGLELPMVMLCWWIIRHRARRGALP